MGHIWPQWPNTIRHFHRLMPKVTKFMNLFLFTFDRFERGHFRQTKFKYWNTKKIWGVPTSKWKNQTVSFSFFFLKKNTTIYLNMNGIWSQLSFELCIFFNWRFPILLFFAWKNWFLTYVTQQLITLKVYYIVDFFWSLWKAKDQAIDFW